MRRVVFLLLFFLLMNAAPLAAQWFIGMKFMGLTFHPGANANKQFYDVTLGKNKKFVLNFGGAVTLEYMFYPNVSVKLDQALFRDCAGQFAGMTMLNLRYTVGLGKPGNGSGGLGPFFYYRRNWNCFDGCIDEGYFRESGNRKWQTKFVWYGGELEYNYPVSEDWDISVNFFPGIPVVYALAPGMRYRLTD